MKNVRHAFFLCLTVGIFLWDIALRAVEVVNKNYLFGFDQGRDYLAAYNIVVNHKFTLIGSEIGAGSAGLNGIYHGPGYYYLIALVYLLFHGDPYEGLLLMFAFGMGTLVVTYVTAKKIFGNSVAILSLFLVGISPLIVSQSRFMWNHHPSSFFIALVLYFAYMIPKKTRVYAPLAILTAGCIYHFELAIAVPMVLTLFLSLPLVFHIKDFKTYIYSIAAVCFAFFPFLLFDSRHGWPALHSLTNYLFGHTGSSQSISWIRLGDHTLSYLNSAANSFMFKSTFVNDRVFMILGVGLFIALVVLAFRTKDVLLRKFFRFLLTLLLVSYGVLLFLNNSVWDYYLIHAHFVYIYVFAYGFVWLISSWRKSVWARIGLVILSGFLIFASWSSLERMSINIRYDLRDLGGVEKINGKKIAMNYIYQDAKGNPFSEFTFMAPIYTYPYDYLFKTYGKDTYGYVPGNAKKGLVYLLIEPDNSKPWLHKGWLETVIVGGDIIKTVKLPTGHIIQVRRFPL
ncbi:MAG: glycosyltransferase family 39 protein [Candidatus Gottesmanbacteria bacterium]|nr:glycosyltransferase family 39 protein [Candidatus Gottesmanbacteria bacterium]